eukprot:COSAG02_NODE_7_length_64539_cov_120.393482_14_plen_158_part_00
MLQSGDNINTSSIWNHNRKTAHMLSGTAEVMYGTDVLHVLNEVNTTNGCTQSPMSSKAAASIILVPQKIHCCYNDTTRAQSNHHWYYAKATITTRCLTSSTNRVVYEWYCTGGTTIVRTGVIEGSFFHSESIIGDPTARLSYCPKTRTKRVQHDPST